MQTAIGRLIAGGIETTAETVAILEPQPPLGQSNLPGPLAGRGRT